MNRDRLMLEFYLTLIGIVFVLLALTGSTFAWFTQTAFTNTELYSASVDGGTSSILISLQQDGEFDQECELIPDNHPDALYPVSTADLNTFYQGSAVKADGITYRYIAADTQNRIIQGRVYLKSINGSNDVYFDDEKFRVSMVDGMDAGLRLGLIIHEQTYIFNLDTGNEEGRVTIEREEDSVVSDIDEQGNPVYTDDPCLDVALYQADGENAGTQTLVRIGEDEVVAVDYFVYVEGCDRNCINQIQNKDLTITLGFQGVEVNAE